MIALDDHSIDIDEKPSEVNSEAAFLGFAKSWKGAVEWGLRCGTGELELRLKPTTHWFCDLGSVTFEPQFPLLLIAIYILYKAIVRIKYKM